MKDPEEFNPGYYQTCLMAVVACVAGILERDEPFTEQDREYLRVHVNSVLHESRKLKRVEFRKAALRWYRREGVKVQITGKYLSVPTSSVTPQWRDNTSTVVWSRETYMVRRS
jgi:hypothetical protein